MIAFLEGMLAEKQPTRIVMNVGGVGYEAFIPLSSYDRLPAEGQTCRVLTYQHVREDILVLYGFAAAAEREMFLLLIGVSGIGPKLALSALSGLSVRELRLAIADGDVKRLSSVSGIGRKTAERMIVELKDRLDVGEVLEARAGTEGLSSGDQRARDAVLALLALGYKQADAQKMAQTALARLPAEATVEEVVRRALAH